jgi:hypothetical protein
VTVEWMTSPGTREIPGSNRDQTAVFPERGTPSLS